MRNWSCRLTSCSAICAIVIRTTLGIALILGANSFVVAQDSDEPPRKLDELVLSQITLDALSDDTNQLILRSIQDSNPQTAVELAKAASVLLDIELNDEAREYLKKIIALNLNEDQLFELQEAVGSNFFSTIQINAAVQPEGSQLSKLVLASATKVGVSPERMNELIKTLNNPDIKIRSAAFRKLRRLGEPAVAELLNVFADEDRKPDFPGVRGALKNMGNSSQGPLLGGARSSNLQVQTESIRALGYFSTSESLDVMMRAYLSPRVPSFLRRTALDTLTRENYPANPEAIEKRLYDRSMEYLLGKRQVSGGLIGDVTVWNWDAASKRMVPSKVSPATAARVIGSQRASDLYEIRPDLLRNREMFLLTQLEAAKRVVGPSRRVNADAMLKRLSPTALELETVLTQAMKLELVPAAVASCELLAKIGDESLLSGFSGRPQPLVEAILFGDRHLQFAAMKAIAAIDPHQSFAGSSFMTSLAIYLAQSDYRPAGLVGHNREDIAQTYAATLANSGLFGIAASNGRDFFRAATSNPDVTVLMVTDTLNQPAYAHLIQQLRNDWRTRRMPVALLYRDINRDRRVQLRMGDDPMFCSAPFSSDPDLVLSHVNRLKDKIEPWPVSNFDRRRHAASAIQWLAKISADRATYSFYDLGSHQDMLVQLIYRPGFADSASQILAGLGTPTAQRELVNFASQTGMPTDERTIAAEAFSQSVEIGGTLLTTAEIQQQYDRYNASENEPAETQKVLSLILDAIEARKRAANSQ